MAEVAAEAAVDALIGGGGRWESVRKMNLGSKSGWPYRHLLQSK